MLAVLSTDLSSINNNQFSINEPPTFENGSLLHDKFIAYTVMHMGAIRPITADRLNAHSTAILRGLRAQEAVTGDMCIIHTQNF